MDYVKVKKGGVSKTIPQNAVDDHRRQGYKVVGRVPAPETGGPPAAGVAELEQELADVRQSFKVVESENAQLQAEVESLKEGSGDRDALQLEQLAEAQQAVENTQAENDALRAVLEKLAADAAASTEEAAALKDELIEANAQIEALQAANEQIEASQADSP